MLYAAGNKSYHWLGIVERGCVDNRKAMARLMRWSAKGTIPAEAFSRLSSCGAYPQAARALAANMLAVAGKDKALDGIFKDGGRYVAAMWAIYAHLTGGLTLPRLKSLCVSSGLVSPGRVRALLHYLRYLGYVEFIPGDGQVHAALYRPTEQFLDAWREHLQAALDAAALIEPAVGLLRERLDQSDVFEAFAREQAASLLEAALTMDRDAAYVRVFLHRNAGMQIMQSLITANPDDVFPPRNPIAFSLAAAARRFDVSRIQIRRVLDAAAKEGLLRFQNERTVVLEESGRTAIALLYQSQLIRLLMAACATIEKEEPLSRPVPPRTRDRGPSADRSHAAAELNAP